MSTAPKPLALTDAQMAAVLASAEPLAPADRDPFLRALAEALRSEPGELGDGTVDRAIRHVIKPYFRAPEVTKEPVHHHRRVGEPIL